MRTEHRDQASFCPFALREVSVLAELALGHLRYYLTDVPPQSNSPPGSVLESDHAGAYVGDRRGRGDERTRAPARAPRRTRRSRRGRETTPRDCLTPLLRLAREHRDSRRRSGRRTRSASPSK